MHPLKFTLYLIAVTMGVGVQAKPVGKAPPSHYEMPGDWQSCFLPIQVVVQAPTTEHPKPAMTSHPVKHLMTGESVKLLKAITVVVSPGIALAIRDFSPNPLKIRVGEQVYVLDDWELDYYKVWAHGTFASGGMPVGDERTFTILRMPAVERWLMIAHPPSTTVTWVPESRALLDEKAISSCTRIVY